MSFGKVWIPITLLGVIVAIGVGFHFWRQAAARTEAIEQRLSSARIEIERDETDRQGLQNEGRALRAAIESLGPEPALVVALARIELRLGRARQAFDALRALPLAQTEDPDVLAVAAAAKAGQHALSGLADDAAEASAFAARSARERPDPAVTFLAWQCAWRAGRTTDASAFADELTTRHADDRHGKLLLALHEFDRVKDASMRDRLLQLEIEFPQTPPELALALATLQLETGDPGEIAAASIRLKDALDKYPSYVDARHVAAVAAHQTGREAERNAHLQWLIANAPKTDARRDAWDQLLQTPLR